VTTPATQHRDGRAFQLAVRLAQDIDQGLDLQIAQWITRLVKPLVKAQCQVRGLQLIAHARVLLRPPVQEVGQAEADGAPKRTKSWK
jgi:hypothetical protein